RTDHPQPALLHGEEMWTAREEQNVGTGPGQQGADVTADRAGAGDDELHGTCRTVNAKGAKNAKVIFRINRSLRSSRPLRSCIRTTSRLRRAVSCRWPCGAAYP